MLHTRQDLLDRAHALYIPILEKAARRYLTGEIPVTIDHVGFSCTMLEELFRPLWGIAPLLRERELTLHIDGRPQTVPAFYADLMIRGTDPASACRFDRNVTDYDREVFANQAVTEIAGYLIAVRFAKELLWDILPGDKQDQIAGWIRTWSVYAIRHSWPNNHYWYPIFCLEVLRYLGYDCSEADDDIRRGFEVLDSLYVGHGWYSDGEFGRFDYYEAWAHHTYPMLWILISDKSRKNDQERCETYRRRTEEFLVFFSHYFDVDGGMCAYGRSISYRFAAAGAYGLAAAAGCAIDYGLAKRIILRNISYFFDKSIPTADGILPPGYLYEALPFVENYTSDGSAYCYTQGFFCLLNAEDSALWQSEEKPLPIEQGAFLVRCPVENIGIVIEGNPKCGVTLYNNSVHYYQEEFFSKRFNDMAGYYSKFAYNSRSGYSISSRDTVSSENMISLYTPDGRMASHRQEIQTIRTTAEVLVSRQIPFSNDPGTKIVTWLLPLTDGYHVRIHKLLLSQSYRVVEGGFSIPLRDDGFTAENGVVRYGRQISRIDAWGERIGSVSGCAGARTDLADGRSGGGTAVEREDAGQVGVCVARDQNRTEGRDAEGEHAGLRIPIKKGSAAAHPGMHLLAPRSIYPCYETENLPAGEYLFVAVVCYVTDRTIPDEAGGEAPVVTRSGTAVCVAYGTKKRNVDITDCETR